MVKFYNTSKPLNENSKSPFGYFDSSLVDNFTVLTNSTVSFYFFNTIYRLINSVLITLQNKFSKILNNIFVINSIWIIPIVQHFFSIKMDSKKI